MILLIKFFFISIFIQEQHLSPSPYIDKNQTGYKIKANITEISDIDVTSINS